MQFKFLAIVTPLVLALVIGSCGKSKKHNLDDDDDDSEEVSQKSKSGSDSIIIDDEEDEKWIRDKGRIVAMKIGFASIDAC